MTTKYPAQIDNSITLPPTSDSITPVQSKVVNDLRGAIIAIETELGVKPSGNFGTVRARLDALTAGSGGGVQLGQDLGGTNDAPLVIGLYGNPLANIAPTNGYILAWNGTDGMWEPIPPPVGATPAITSFVVGTTLLEVNQSIVDPSFTASYNFTTSSVVLTDSDGNPPKDVSSTPTSFTSNDTYTKSSFGDVETFTIAVSPNSLSANAHITWGQKNYFGIGTTGQTGGSFIVSLTATAISLSRNASFTVNATVGNKIYYATRTAYGTPTFKDASTGFALDIGLSGNFSVTNGFGFSENYQLWESTFTGLLSITVDVT